MKTDFKFSNLLGTVYCQGNLLFSPDGTHLFSPVGNRVTVFNLVEYALRLLEALSAQCANCGQ
jgi:periodic tryptophan protein 2